MKKKNAISLIVLVITIIVMVILAATVIITLSNTNIINKANEAVKKTEAQQIEEMKALMLADGMMGNNPESVTIGDTTLTWDDTNKKVLATVQGIIIPDGFSYVEGTKDTGLVIEDKEQNQFVWVPVEYTATGTNDANGLDTGFTAVFKRGTAEETSTGSGIYKMTGALGSSYVEPNESGYEGEEKEYYAMMLSVQKNKGFYIARFEAGDGDATEARTSVTPERKVVSKRGAYVYTYVPWGASDNNIGPLTVDNIEVPGAVYLSKKMYSGSESVVSTLCYGVEWDAIMNFVSDADHNIKDSRSWGNYMDSTDAAAVDSGAVQTCGKNEAWKAKNIYDLAGNVYEVTMEKFIGTGAEHRGGGFQFDCTGTVGSASSRFSGVYDPAFIDSESVGFRVALYIK